jgi:hypothetical protein
LTVLPALAVLHPSAVLPALAGASSANTSLLAQPGTVAFLVVFGMGVLCFFLFRSMSKHLRKVNQMARDEEEAAARDQVQADGGAAAGVSGNGSGVG